MKISFANLLPKDRSRWSVDLDSSFYFRTENEKERYKLKCRSSLSWKHSPSRHGRELPLPMPTILRLPLLHSGPAPSDALCTASRSWSSYRKTHAWHWTTKSAMNPWLAWTTRLLLIIPIITTLGGLEISHLFVKSISFFEIEYEAHMKVWSQETRKTWYQAVRIWQVQLRRWSYPLRLGVQKIWSRKALFFW